MSSEQSEKAEVTEPSHRGVFLFIDDEGKIHYQTIGEVSEAESLGISNYLSAVIHDNRANAVLNAQMDVLKGIKSITEILSQQAEERSCSCGKDSSEESLPSSDSPCSTENSPCSSKDSSPEKE